MKINLVILIAMVFSTTVFVSCYRDKEEELYPIKTSCDTTSTISYSQQVEPLFNTYCKACHNTSNNNSAGGNLNLEGYDNFSQWAKNGIVLQSIKHESGISPMPKNSPKLSDCNIRIIEKWIDEGILNN